MAEFPKLCQFSTCVAQRTLLRSLTEPGHGKRGISSHQWSRWCCPSLPHWCLCLFTLLFNINNWGFVMQNDIIGRVDAHLVLQLSNEGRTPLKGRRLLRADGRMGTDESLTLKRCLFYWGSTPITELQNLNARQPLRDDPSPFRYLCKVTKLQLLLNKKWANRGSRVGEADSIFSMCVSTS